MLCTAFFCASPPAALTAVLSASSLPSPSRVPLLGGFLSFCVGPPLSLLPPGALPQAWLIAERAAARRSGGRGHDAGRVRHAPKQVKSPSGGGQGSTAVRFCGSNCFVLGCPLCSTSSRTLGHGNLATVGRCPGCCTCCSLCSRAATGAGGHHAQPPSSSSS